MTRRWLEGRNGPPVNEPTPEQMPAVAAAGPAELSWHSHIEGRPPRPGAGPHLTAAAHGWSCSHARQLSQPASPTKSSASDSSRHAPTRNCRPASTTQLAHAQAVAPPQPDAYAPDAHFRIVVPCASTTPPSGLPRASH